MANTAGIATTFKSEILIKTHNLNTDVLKAALYMASASIGPGTAAYTGTGEVSSSGYTTGGVTVTNGTVATSGTTAYWTPGAAFSWSGVTIAAPGTDCCLIYNTSASNKAIGSFTYGATTVTAGNFTLNMPTNDASNALIRAA